MVQNHKERNFTSNYFIFLKILFQFKNLLYLFWCTNNINARSYTFRKRWSFIWGWFFPVSILKPSKYFDLIWNIH